MSPQQPTGHTGDDDLLAGVLRAAAAPAHPGELAGEEAAVAAFRQAALVETAPARPSAFRRVLTKVLTVKAAVAIAVVGSAGVVLAASGGVLPTPWSVVPPADQGPASTTAPAAPATTGNPATEPDSSARPAPRAGEPAVLGLCRAYAAGDAEQRADPKFRRLVAAAGGADGVAEYCATHAATPSKNSSKNEPGISNPGKSPNTDKSEKNKPENTPKNTPKNTGGAKPTAPPGESVKPGENPASEANKPPLPAKPSAKTPAGPQRTGGPKTG